MENRRDFLKISAATVAAMAARPLSGWQGANDRVRMGVIGMGTRAARVFDSLTRNQDCQFIMGCEVNAQKQATFQASNRPFAKIDVVNDYPNLVVQVGTHQRSWDHFIEAKKQLEKLDPITHVLIQQPGAYSAQMQDPVAVPEYLNWEQWQV